MTEANRKRQEIIGNLRLIGKEPLLLVSMIAIMFNRGTDGNGHPGRSQKHIDAGMAYGTCRGRNAREDG